MFSNLVLFWVSFVSIFCSEIVLFPCHPVVGMSSCILLLLAGRIFFRCFGMSCFVCIVLSCLDIFLVFFLSPEPSDLFPWVVLFVFLVMLLFSFRPDIFQRFLWVLWFLLVIYRRFLICVSRLISHPGFEFLFVFYGGTPILSQTSFAPA